MPVIDKPLLELTAMDLMSRDLLVIPDNMPLRQAAHMLLRNQVSGAPVVNCQGALTGVLSATDFVRQLGRPCECAKDSLASSNCPDDFFADWQMMETDSLPTDAVRHFMTPDSVTTVAGTLVSELARMMVDAHIHRLIVVDDDNAPLGIVTSTDVLAAVARAKSADSEA